jgi:hypothetical protein
MRIVDAQIHLWGSGLPSNMVHRQDPSFTAEEVLGLMDDGGVDAAVIHFPERFAILGVFPLNQPHTRALVDTWRSQPSVRDRAGRGGGEPGQSDSQDRLREWLA